MKKIQNQDSKHSFEGGGYLYNKTNIKYIVSLSIVLIGILSLLSGTSYAILKGNTSDTKEQVIKTGKIELTLTENYNNINKKITVMSDEDGLLQEETYDFNIKNTGDAPAKYDLKLINEVPSTYTGKVLDTKYIKIGLEINGTEYGPMSLEKVKNIIDSDIIYKKEMINFKMRIWLDKTKEKDIENLEDYKAFLKLKIEAVQRPESMDSGVNTKTFNYTGKPEEYTVPRDGYYYIEMAGAQGGSLVSTNTQYGKSIGGKGAKTSGYIYLEANEKIYFYVGGEGSTSTSNEYIEGGYNGGGKGHSVSAVYPGASGGEATDVRLTSDSWNNTKSLISRIMVAAGGGGASLSSNKYSDGAAGGGLLGEKPRYTSVALYGTTNSGGQADTTLTNNGTSGTFAVGGNGGADATGGGGAGYYGGAGASQGSAINPGGSGGSSYISGYAGVNSVKELTTITHTNETLHYSGKYFIDGKMYEDNNSGNGYAKISYVDTKPKRRNAKLNNVRYVKDCIGYNSDGNRNYWVEVEAIKDGVNIAKGKTVNASSSAASEHPFSVITDGIVSSSNYATPTTSSTNYCITIDLEKEYDLDEVAVFHTYGAERSMYNTNTYVSNDNSNYINVIPNDITSEKGQGRRVNAYSDIINGYMSDGLVLWYDGINNNGNSNNTSNYSVTTWKNLANSSYSGTLKNSPTWYNNYLFFDGSDDWVSIAQMNFNNPTVEVVIQKSEYTTGPEESIVANYEGGGYGLSIANQKLISEFYISGAYHNIYKDFVLNKKVSVATNYDNSKTNLYTNGTLYDSYSITGSIGVPESNTPMVIAANPRGTSTTDPNRFFKGNIYSVRIYNRALTQEEILHNYNYDKQRFNIE